MLLMHIKMNIDQEHDVIFKQAVRIADLLKLNLIFSELPRNRFVETMCQRICLKITI